MPVPSIKNATVLAAALGNKTVTIACVNCKKPLWEIKVNLSNDRVVSTETREYPGVKKYGDVWRKKWDKENHNTNWECTDTKCPFCGKDHLQVLLAAGKQFAKPYSPELDG